MKGFEEIKKYKKDGDYELVAEALGLSKATIRSIVNGRRTDKNHVLLAFNILFKLRDLYPMLVKQHIDGKPQEDFDIKIYGFENGF